MKRCSSISFTGHALRRMFERGLMNNEVLFAIQTGEVIMDYPDDRPHPSQLRLGWVGEKAIHDLVSQASGNDACYVITAYYPALAIWADDFKTRRS